MLRSRTFEIYILFLVFFLIFHFLHTRKIELPHVSKFVDRNKIMNYNNISSLLSFVFFFLKSSSIVTNLIYVLYFVQKSLFIYFFHISLNQYYVEVKILNSQKIYVSFFFFFFRFISSMCKYITVKKKFKNVTNYQSSLSVSCCMSAFLILQ